MAALHLYFVTPGADIRWDFTIEPADYQRLIDEDFGPIRRLEMFLHRMPSVRDSNHPRSPLLWMTSNGSPTTTANSLP